MNLTETLADMFLSYLSSQILIMISSFANVVEFYWNYTQRQDMHFLHDFLPVLQQLGCQTSAYGIRLQVS